MRKNRLSIFNGIAALALVLTLLGSTSIPAAARHDNPRADPRLIAMAEEHPDDTFAVLVQRMGKNKDLKNKNSEINQYNRTNQDLANAVTEREVLRGGGRMRKHLGVMTGFSAELTGREILRLARLNEVRWISFDAPVFVAGGFGGYTYRDEFTAAAYRGTNGTENWSGSPWVETGKSDGALRGKVMVVAAGNCASAYCLRIGSGSGAALSGAGAVRQADLHGATYATLSFSSRIHSSAFFATGAVNLEISSDGGATWTPLDSFPLKYSTNAQSTKSYDISAYATSSTAIRFVGEGMGTGYLYVDNVQIEYTRASNSYIFSTQTNHVWAENSAPGSDVTVAVVDSGLANHPDLYAGTNTRIIASVDFTGGQDCELFIVDPAPDLNAQPIEAQPIVDTTNVAPAGCDAAGHGTHVAGIIGGMGQASDGARRGNAPFVNLIDVKVSSADGSAYLSNVISGLQWIYDNRSAYNIRVVNISMNSAVPEPYDASALDAAVEILWLNGITVVVSAGNNGAGEGPVPLLPPANDPFVITVGAADDMGTGGLEDDAVAKFSAYGLTEDGFAKPDLVAPGRNIISLLSSTSSTAYVEHPSHRVDNYYFRMSGTSMAAPMVTGAVALMLQKDPSLNPDQIKFRLMATAQNAWPGYLPDQAGAGYLDTYAAVNGTSDQSANHGVKPSLMLLTGKEPLAWDSVGWNSVGWNSVGWNSVGWNSVGWNSVGWNSVGWNSQIWDP